MPVKMTSELIIQIIKSFRQCSTFPGLNTTAKELSSVISETENFRKAPYGFPCDDITHAGGITKLTDEWQSHGNDEEYAALPESS